MITVELHKFEGGNSGQAAFAYSSRAFLEQMLNNPLFLERLNTVTYSRNIYFPNDTYQIEATNDDLLRVITGGVEWSANPGGQEPDNEIDLSVTLKKIDNPDVWGYGEYKEQMIYTSYNKFDKWWSQNNWIDLGGHWFHEWLHLAGFQHANLQPGEQPDFNDAVYTVGNLLVNSEREWQDRQGDMKREEVAKLGQGYFEMYNIPAKYQYKV